MSVQTARVVIPLREKHSLSVPERVLVFQILNLLPEFKWRAACFERGELINIFSSPSGTRMVINGLKGHLRTPDHNAITVLNGLFIGAGNRQRLHSGWLASAGQRIKFYTYCRKSGPNFQQVVISISSYGSKSIISVKRSLISPVNQQRLVGIIKCEAIWTKILIWFSP